MSSSLNKTNQKIWVLIPASGVGSRMQSAIPKQYLPFQNKTIIESTLDRLLSLDAICGAIIVLNEADKFWQKLNYQHDKPVVTALGASERSGSVLNGLKCLGAIEDKANLWVMIHDAVRPCVTHADLQKLVDASLNEPEGLFLGHPVADTLKRINNDNCSQETIDRSQLWRAFTPQMFPFDLILKASQHVWLNQINITDDVSAVEAIGGAPKIILGEPDNIKITFPQDIKMAELVFKKQKNK